MSLEAISNLRTFYLLAVGPPPLLVITLVFCGTAPFSALLPPYIQFYWLPPKIAVGIPVGMMRRLEFAGRRDAEVSFLSRFEKNSDFLICV